MTRHVSFTGILRGGGSTADCSVSARKITPPKASVARYIDYSISQVSQELPDGRYELMANGESIRAGQDDGRSGPGL
jgi:hypothetical protein